MFILLSHGFLKQEMCSREQLSQHGIKNFYLYNLKPGITCINYFALLEEGEISQVRLCLRISENFCYTSGMISFHSVCSRSLSLVCIIISLGLDLQMGQICK